MVSRSLSRVTQPGEDGGSELAVCLNEHLNTSYGCRGSGNCGGKDGLSEKESSI